MRPTGAVPSLEEGGATNCQLQTILSGVEKVLTGSGSDSNGRTMPNPNPEMPGTNRKKRMKKNKNEGYNLNCWSLWWRRMEREGVKKGVDRHVLSMQKSVSHYMTKNDGLILRKIPNRTESKIGI
jgi:hypothetical protein